MIVTSLTSIVYCDVMLDTMVVKDNRLVIGGNKGQRSFRLGYSIVTHLIVCVRDSLSSHLIMCSRSEQKAADDSSWDEFDKSDNTVNDKQ